MPANTVGNRNRNEVHMTQTKVLQSERVKRPKREFEKFKLDA